MQMDMQKGGDVISNYPGSNTMQNGLQLKKSNLSNQKCLLNIGRYTLSFYKGTFMNKHFSLASIQLLVTSGKYRKAEKLHKVQRQHV